MLVPDAADVDEGVARLLTFGEDHDVELAGGALCLGELSLGSIHGQAGDLVRSVVREEFTEEALAQFGVDRLAGGQGGEFLARAAADLVHGVAGLGGDGEAEAADVGVA